MDPNALVEPQIEAGEWLVAEFNKYKPVRAAYWLKTADDTDWYLHISSDLIDDSNRRQAYGEILRIVNHAKNPWLDPFQVKVLGADDRVARAIADFAKYYPDRPLAIVRGATPNGVWADGAIVYTPPFGAQQAVRATAKTNG